MGNDCWANRKSGMKCKTCVFFVPKKADGKDGMEGLDGVPSPAPYGAIGRCRANPPTMKGFPIVFEQDWCGYHRIDENKI